MSTSAETLARTGGKHISHVLFSEEQIARRVRELGEQITREIPEGEDILVLGLLKGSFIFVSDLVREIRRPIEVDFLIVSSYGGGTESSGEVQLLYARQASIEGKHVILVEDIVDSGTTLNRLIPMLEKRGPKSLEVAALLHKHIAKEMVRDAKWVGFDCPQEFVIGYGLDHSEKYRHLPFVGVIEP
ncbi:hypoxanthine phosphoribosyltransferase [Longimicrobium sp.]|uniref:hypoxanthine phosphoribosyltransferase n=1 Tax=Longimicrobium sp. TaxID=2029185 RepID=UPI002E31DE5D|nr:hypoxanthine phosphoribosyltransferase [Longimicrobium sp.]HEX6039103.1 hypoxanthine phosphoribosyltransferase [Longimicrobium sp.]